MPRKPRYEVADPAEVQVVHTVERCVRHAFLCGEDSHTGQSFEDRRAWVRQRLEFLASVFGIDCLTYTVLHNHSHSVLRSRLDVVAAWSDEEVATRWLRLFPRRRKEDGSPETPTKPEIDMIVNRPEVLAERRARLLASKCLVGERVRKVSCRYQWLGTWSCWTGGGVNCEPTRLVSFRNTWLRFSAAWGWTRPTGVMC